MSRSIDPDEALANIRNAIALLGAYADEQRNYLAALELEGSLDELALQYSDIFPIVMRMVESGALPEGVKGLLVAIEEKLSNMSG